MLTISHQNNNTSLHLKTNERAQQMNTNGGRASGRGFCGVWMIATLQTQLSNIRTNTHAHTLFASIRFPGAKLRSG